MKLTYFAVRGRVESARLLLELAGAAYEYVGVQVEQWGDGGKAAMLARTPFGQMPLLEDGDVVVSQSQAVLRHLARRLDLAGTTPAEQALVDEICETAVDVAADSLTLCWDREFAKKREAHRASMGTKLDRLEAYFERVSPDAQHWALPAKFCAADAAMAAALEILLPIHPGLVEAHPKIDAAMRAFFSEPRIRAYVTSDRRPRTLTVPMATFAGRADETHQWDGSHLLR